MIPQRNLGAAIFENAVRARVTACRKRLRVSRVAHRANLDGEAAPAQAGIEDGAFREESPSVRQSLYEFSSSASVSRDEDHERSSGDPEVGIT